MKSTSIRREAQVQEEEQTQAATSGRAQQAGRTGKWQNWAPPPPKAQIVRLYYSASGWRRRRGRGMMIMIMRICMKIGLVPLHHQAKLQAIPYNCQKKPFKISIQPLTL